MPPSQLKSAGQMVSVAGSLVTLPQALETKQRKRMSCAPGRALTEKLNWLVVPPLAMIVSPF